MRWMKKAKNSWKGKISQTLITRIQAKGVLVEATRLVVYRKYYLIYVITTK